MKKGQEKKEEIHKLQREKKKLKEFSNKLSVTEGGRKKRRKSRSARKADTKVRKSIETQVRDLRDKENTLKRSK